MPPAARVAAHVRRSAEAGDPAERRSRRIRVAVELQGRADKQVARIVTRHLTHRAIRTHRTIGTDEEHIRSG